MGLGEAVQNPKIIEGTVEELSKIAGQRAVIPGLKNRLPVFQGRARIWAKNQAGAACGDDAEHESFRAIGGDDQDVQKFRLPDLA